MSRLEKRYRKSGAIVSRKIGDDFVMVPIRQDVENLSSIYVLNDVAARIWDLIDSRNTVSSILRKIVDEYNVDPQEAERDIIEYLQILENSNIIVSH
jgi:hypothetical protein